MSNSSEPNKEKPFIFTPTSEEMKLAFELISKSEKFIVIGNFLNEDGNMISRIIHETDGPRDTSLYLKDWSNVMKEKADHQDQLRNILGDSGIEGL